MDILGKSMLSEQNMNKIHLDGKDKLLIVVEFTSCGFCEPTENKGAELLFKIGKI